MKKRTREKVALLVFALLVVLGGSFGIKTVYVTLLLSGALSLAEILYPELISHAQ